MSFNSRCKRQVMLIVFTYRNGTRLVETTSELKMAYLWLQHEKRRGMPCMQHNNCVGIPVANNAPRNLLNCGPWTPVSLNVVKVIVIWCVSLPLAFAQLENSVWLPQVSIRRCVSLLASKFPLVRDCGLPFGCFQKILPMQSVADVHFTDHCLQEVSSFGLL